MLKIISIILVFFISIANVMANNPDQLFRGDKRNPQAIIDAGGFMPVGDGSPPGLQDARLFVHASGLAGATDHTVYVSTSASIRVAAGYGYTGAGQPHGYVYMIHPAENLYSTNELLGQFTPEEDDEEYAALGGVPLQQIMGWREIIAPRNGARPPELGPYVPNPYYRRDIYDGMSVSTISGGAYSLAGFPPNHAGWVEDPWRRFAPNGCNRLNRAGADIKDTCEISVDAIGSARRKAFDKRIHGYNKVINVPLKVSVGGSSSDQCIVLGDYRRTPAVADCGSAPIVRYTRYGQFQFANVNNIMFPLCLSISHAMRTQNSNWDYMAMLPCDSTDPYQRLIPSSKGGTKSEMTTLARGYKVSKYGGWLIASKPGYEGEKIEVKNNGYKNYFEGTKPYADVISLDIRYSYNKEWWYPVFFTLSDTTTAYTQYYRTFYNRDSHKLIDEAGGCLAANRAGDEDIRTWATGSLNNCYSPATSSDWKISVSKRGNQSVKITSYSGRTLMSEPSTPRLMTSRDEEYPTFVSEFFIEPWAKSELGIYDPNDVLIIYKEPYRTGDSLSFTRSVESLGAFNNQMSSWTIPKGWSVIFYEGENYTGKFYSRSTSVELDDAISGKIKSIKVLNGWSKG